MRSLALVLLAVLAQGCNSPAYDAFIKEQEKWATMGADSSGTTDALESSGDPGGDAAGEGTSTDASVGETDLSAGATSVGSTTGPDETTSGSTGDVADDSTSTGSAAFCGDGVINQDFEECDVPGPADPEGPCTATCQRSRIIFALSLSLNGNMNGLQGADAYCKSQAVKAKKADPSSALQSAGTFKALLSTSKETVFDRHFQGEGPYRLVNGLTVSNSFKALFSEPLQTVINVDEFGLTRDVLVWTGTDGDGWPYPGIDFCGDWTDDEGSSNYGFSDVIDMWIDVGDEVIDNPNTPCYANRAVYCVEQE